MSDTLNYKTNIPELDALIGRQRIKPGTILIIKGGPGSGKTTLGLQILKKHLEKNISLEGTFCAAFISLEIPHAKILNYVNVSYHFGLTCDKNDCDRYLFVASREDIEKEISQSFSNETHIDPGDAIFQSLKHLDCELGEENKEEQKSFEEYKRNNSYNFIFIDNLNILVDIITDQTTYNLDIRKALNYICRSFTEEPNNTVFIFSVEYHSSMHEINTIISESFMCDYEVLLNVEPIYGDFRKIKSDINALGYYIETDKQGMEKSIETRSFCRVLKARYSKNLSLRYAYDIVEGKGIEFYNTYPGDGEINLFYENKPQEDHWENCFNYDIKFSYPSLRKDKFDKSSLQRTFSSLRQLKHIPEKTDLYLTSLDNYWINWYADLKRKWFIYDIVNANFRHGKERRADVAQSEEKKLVNVVTNIIHRELTRNDFKRERLKHRITARIKVEPASFKSIMNESNEDPERYIKYIKQEVSEEICSVIHNFLSEEPLYHCFECNYTIWLFETLHNMLPKQSIEFHKEEFEIIRNLRQAERKKWLERVRKELDRLKRENEEISDAYYYLDSTWLLPWLSSYVLDGF
ncbi:MAG: ATPase domain-containing protein [Bacteroidales bacterium]|jgi:DNA polymerase III delta prime subunit